MLLLFLQRLGLITALATSALIGWYKMFTFPIDGSRVVVFFSIAFGSTLCFVAIFILITGWYQDHDDWIQLRKSMNSPGFFENFRIAEEKAWNFCEMDSPPDSEYRFQCQSTVKRSYEKCEKQLQQYMEYHKTKTGAASDANVEEGFPFISLLHDTLELRKKALIQACDKFKSIPPEQRSRWGATSSIINEFIAIECSIVNFHQNGWKEQIWKKYSTSDKLGDMIIDAKERGELYDQSIAKADDLMSWLAYHEYLAESGRGEQSIILEKSVLGYKYILSKWKIE